MRPIHETVVLTLSDAHFGKKTATFNPSVFVKRMEGVQRQVALAHRSMQSSNRIFDELVIFLLGDLVDGTMIYPTQVHHQMITDINSQIIYMSDMLAKFARSQQPLWGKVRFECVPGNHGRSGRFNHENSNFDLLLYEMVKMRLENDRAIPVGINNDHDNKFIRVVPIRKFNYLLYHGMDIRMYQQIPWYGISQRVLRWHATKRFKFDVACFGHFHSTGLMDINRISMILSGTAVTDDEWALQTFGYESQNAWWLFGVSDAKPIAWSHKVLLGHS